LGAIGGGVDGLLEGEDFLELGADDFPFFVGGVDLGFDGGEVVGAEAGAASAPSKAATAAEAALATEAAVTGATETTGSAGVHLGKGEGGK
jgi:hypothetical protein